MKRSLLSIPGLSAVLLSLINLSGGCNDRHGPDFRNDVYPIIAANCSGCHSPGGGGPFRLLTYTDVAKRAKMIAYVTGTGYMPPWPADKAYTHFINERGLTKSEKKLLREWYERGCPPGDTAGWSPEPVQRKSTLGKPDMVIALEPVVIENNNRDRFYVMKIPASLPAEKYVKAVEFIPGQPDYAHHVNGHYLRLSDDTDPFAGKRLADVESETYDTEFEALKLLNSDGSLPQRIHSAVNYLPGAFGVRYPEGIGGFLMGRKGAFVANDIHYGPSRKRVTDSSLLCLYFSDGPPERTTYEVMMGTNGVSAIEPPLMVEAGKISRHVSRMTIFNDISVLTVNPHMHLIGKSFLAYAIKPNGDTVRLISIPRWQFRWQYFYTYRNPVKIPRGSTLVVEAVFDNTASNPDNPFNPPRTIGERLDRGGASMRTTDEMLQFIITYMPYRKGDENIDLSRR